MKTNDPIKGDGFQQMLPRGRGVNGLIRRPTPLDTKETQVEPLDTKETHVEPQDASGQLLTGGRGRRRPRARERSPGTGSHANGRSGKRLCSRPALLLFVSSLTADKRLLRNHENVLMVKGGRAAAAGQWAVPLHPLRRLLRLHWLLACHPRATEIPVPPAPDSLDGPLAPLSAAQARPRRWAR